MSYNPYEAVKKITEEKRGWANAKAQGKDPSEYQNNARKYYEELRNNGRADAADYLEKSDSVQAGEYLKSFSPEYEHTSEGLQKKSDDFYSTGKKYLDSIAKSYDSVYKNNINVDPTATSYGKNIINSYGISANNAYKSALGSGAEANGGNVDSYAAANADRQKTAVMSQGYGDVLNYYNSIAGNAGDWAKNKASSLSEYLSQLGANISGDRSALAEKQNAENAKYGYDTEKYISDNSLAETKVNTEASKYVSDNDYAGTVYKADSDYAGTAYKADRDYAGTVYKADSDRAKSAASDASSVYIQQLKNSQNADSAEKSGYSYDVDSVIDGIINKYTTDRLGTTSEKTTYDEYGKGKPESSSYEYGKIGSQYDDDSIKSELAHIADNLPEDSREEFAMAAMMRGYDISGILNGTEKDSGKANSNFLVGAVGLNGAKKQTNFNQYALRSIGDKYISDSGGDPKKMFDMITGDSSLSETQKAHLLEYVGLGSYLN